MTKQQREVMPGRVDSKSTQPVQFLRLNQVRAVTGMSRSWIYAAMIRRDFPASFLLGARAVAWDSRAITDWQMGRIAGAAKRRGGQS